MILLGYGTDIGTPSPEQVAWLALVSLAGTWAVLISAKFWEGTHGEATMRRFIMMVIGMGLGVLAFEIASAVMVRLPYDPDFGPHQPHTLGLQTPFYSTDGQPLVLAYMASFGTLFLVLRWWRMADPLRSSRLSLWSLVVCGVAAWLVGALWCFPQPWFMMAAGTTAVAVQLASPWSSSRSRRRKAA